MNSGTALLLAATAVAVATVIIFNRMVALRSRFENAFDQVDANLMQRNELILRIVEKARAYIQHESVTLTLMIRARNNAAKCCENVSLDPGNCTYLEALASAEQVLSNVVARFSGLSESYPKLKANTGIKELHDELTAAQNRAIFPRQAFNDAVSNYNRF